METTKTIFNISGGIVCKLPGILNNKITYVGKRMTRDKLLSYLLAESISFDMLIILYLR